jgi:hypothetical protein
MLQVRQYKKTVKILLLLIFSFSMSVQHLTIQYQLLGKLVS